MAVTPVGTVGGTGAGEGDVLEEQADNNPENKTDRIIKRRTAEDLMLCVFKSVRLWLKLTMLYKPCLF
jgi:hypothetical protein